MDSDLERLDVMGDAIAEAIQLYGTDWRRIKEHLETRLGQLSPEDRHAVDVATAKILSFSAPNWPRLKPQ